MSSVAFCTLGCKVNQYETEAMTELFKGAGYVINEFEDISDVYVINTCTVTGTGDKKSRQMIRRAKHTNPDAIVAVVGCYSQVSPEEVAKIDGVNLILGTNDRGRVVELVEQCMSGDGEPVFAVGDIMKTRKYEQLWVTSYDDRTRAYVKIEDGCIEFCSYCIIPYARGPIRSRDVDDIVREVAELAKSGFCEVVLTGIHLASYGKDRGDISLIDAIRAVHDIDGIKRIRLGSLEPRLLTESFVEKISAMPKVCDHFHISLQSGCDDTLKRMNRKYTSEEFYEGVCRLRKHYNNPAITTDIIVGFAGETDSEFEQSLDFVSKVAFSEAHVFPYSIRKGTRAAKLPDQLTGDVKDERAHRMSAVCKALHEEYMNAFIGETVSVLFERETESGIYEGHTTNYIRVNVPSDKDISHEILNVKIKSHSRGVAVGEIE